MILRQHQPERPCGKARADAPEEPASEAISPFDKFRTLTRRLLQVTREELAAEEQRHKTERKRLQRRGKAAPDSDS
jgi:hypothetical protein